MNKENLIILFKCILFSIIIFILATILGKIINNLKNYPLPDILLLEGIVLTILGAFSCIGTGSTGLYFKTDRSSNTQFTITDHSGKTKYERDITSIRNILPLSMLNFSLIIGGILIFLTSYII